MLLESRIHLFSLSVVYWSCHFVNHLLMLSRLAGRSSGWGWSPGWRVVPPIAYPDLGKEAHAWGLHIPAHGLCNCAYFWRSVRKKLLVDHVYLFNVVDSCNPKGPVLSLWTLVTWQRSGPVQLQQVKAPVVQDVPVTHWEGFAGGKSFIGFVDFLRQLWLQSQFCCSQHHSLAFSFPLWIYIKMSFHCLSSVNILGYFLQRDFYVFINQGHSGASGYLSAPRSWLPFYLYTGLHYCICGMANS